MFDSHTKTYALTNIVDVFKISYYQVTKAMEQEGSGGGGFRQLYHGIKSSEPPNFKGLSSKCLICDSPSFRHIIILSVC